MRSSLRAASVGYDRPRADDVGDDDDAVYDEGQHSMINWIHSLMTPHYPIHLNPIQNYRWYSVTLIGSVSSGLPQNRIAPSHFPM